MIDIKDKSGKVRFSTPVNSGSKRKFQLMKEDYITLKFSLDTPVYFKLGDYVDEAFGLFEICDPQKPVFNNETGGYDYDLRLDAHYWKWKNKLFKFTPETAGREVSWNLTATLDKHLNVFLRNLTALGYTFKGDLFEPIIDDTVEKSAKHIQYDNMNMLDALFEMAKTWECECWIIGNEIHFGRCEHGDPVDFEFGVNVDTMDRSDSQSAYATRIFAFGSTRNLTADYRPVDESAVVNGVAQKRLMLPADTPYVDAFENMSNEEAIESVVVFEDVYPRRVATVSDVKPTTSNVVDGDNKPTGETYPVYTIKDTNLKNLKKEHVIDELRIIFQSGKLNGLSFALESKLSDDTGSLFKIVRNEEYGRFLPDDVLKPIVGDQYVLYGFDPRLVSDTMVPDAEQELKERALQYIEKSKIDPSTYTVKMMSGYMFGIHPETGEPDETFARHFEAGSRVNLINKVYFENSRQSRIIGYEYNLDLPYDSPTFTIGETAAYSRIAELESKVDSITYKGSNYTYSNGTGGFVSSGASGTKLKENILVTSKEVGYIKSGNVLMMGMTWEEILRKMFYEPAQAKLDGRLSTANDVEYGSSKGTITYTAARNGQGEMKSAFYDLDPKKVLTFSTEVDGIQTAIRQLEGVYTTGESYHATVTYGASEDGELPENVLTNKISVNVRRKWFAGACNSIPATSAEVRALGSSGFYTGANTYSFNVDTWTYMVICIPFDSISDVSRSKTPGNYLESPGVYRGTVQINVDGANNSDSIPYTMYKFQVDTHSDADKFTFKTITK